MTNNCNEYARTLKSDVSINMHKSKRKSHINVIISVAFVCELVSEECSDVIMH